MTRFYIALLTFLFSAAIFSAPREIVIIRHGDKLPKHMKGQFLSPKGQLRAEKFSHYYLTHFPKPDAVFATRPALNNSKESHSFRPIQTVAPLVNALCKILGRDFLLQWQYYNDQYPALAHDVLTNKNYNNKQILICWHHGRINRLSKALGVKQSLPKWKSDNFDQVYVIDYDDKGAMKKFQLLKNQYPVV